MGLTLNALTTLSRTKNVCNIPTADTTQDSMLEEMIEDYSDVVSKICQRVFPYAAYVEKIEGSDRQLLLLNQYPAWTITYVKSDGDTIDSSEYETLAYDIERGAIFMEKGWYAIKFTTGMLSFEPTAKKRMYEISYSAGYYMPADTINYGKLTGKDLPRDIQLAVSAIVAEEYNRIKNGGYGVTSIKQGGLAYTFADKNNLDPYMEGISPGNMAKLAKYRRWYVG